MKQHDLVLLGGGHTHVLVIKALAMKPIDGVRVTLISEKSLTPYSGMLPGYVSGHYSLEQTNIDLNQLCRKAGVRWINAYATSIDPDLKRISLRDAPDIEFDVLSIDIGSTPDQRIIGAREYATGVKPITGFQSQWHALQTQLNEKKSTADSNNSSINWGVIGAGAGGVELVLAMAYRLKSMPDLRLHLICRGPTILSGYPAKVVKIVETKLSDFKVTLHTNFSVSEVTNNGIHSTDHNTLDLDQSIWCTGAVGAPWLVSSSLATNEKQFIKVTDTLQSTSHKHVFAVGDIAQMTDSPRPKAGVFAVRQAPWLVKNLRRYFANTPLVNVTLQSQFLSMLALGDKTAVASRNNIVVSGSWVWRWKDSIDRKFMDQFSQLPMLMSPHANATENDSMPCAGCGSKLGPNLLVDNLNQLADSSTRYSHNLPEDANILEPKSGYSMLQSIDGFRSFTSDEYRFTRICVNHALSDINAMGASPAYAQAWVNLMFNHSRLHQRDHLRILKALNEGLQAQGAQLIGGHSSEGAETFLGIVANGEVKRGEHWPKSGAQPGDVLLLSKPLGTGVILAADMQAAATAESVDAAYKTMLRSNFSAAQRLLPAKPNAVTDVTGFGLIGHLLEMIDGASQRLQHPINAQLELASIPIIAGAKHLSRANWRSSLYPQLQPYLRRCNYAPTLDSNDLDLLIDPQTSGGLLVSLPPDSATLLLQSSDEFIIIGSVNLSENTGANEPQVEII